MKALELAHVPVKIINTINGLMSTWATKKLTGVLQGDCMGLTLFILNVNPLSFLLKNLPGHKLPGKRKNKVSNLFLVDDLKTYTLDAQEAKLQFDLITTITKISVCNLVMIERRKQVSLDETFYINDVHLNQLENRKTLPILRTR